MLDPLVLTRREAQVVRRLFNGMPIPVIAKELRLTNSRVSHILSGVYKRAGVRSDIGLLALARRNGGYLY
jgi:DNA-binding NarL/FixJ family response regulator